MADSTGLQTSTELVRREKTGEMNGDMPNDDPESLSGSATESDSASSDALLKEEVDKQPVATGRWKSAWERFCRSLTEYVNCYPSTGAAAMDTIVTSLGREEHQRRIFAMEVECLRRLYDMREANWREKGGPPAPLLCDGGGAVERQPGGTPATIVPARKACQRVYQCIACIHLASFHNGLIEAVWKPPGLNSVEENRHRLYREDEENRHRLMKEDEEHRHRLYREREEHQCRLNREEHRCRLLREEEHQRRLHEEDEEYQCRLQRCLYKEKEEPAPRPARRGNPPGPPSCSTKGPQRRRGKIRSKSGKG
ncbi:hypothetical protein KEM56_006740 [Ascosphaera pollenicola]|nr:hypothetical protein KEM56_006740 [Ascosphaera pollenicola]